MYRYRYYSQSFLTDTVQPDGNYILWERKNNLNGRYPKHDLESVADDMECIFSIPYRRKMIDVALTENRNSGFPVTHFNTADYTPNYMERAFLVKLQEVLEERGVDATIKARGRCSRRGKKAWSFETLEYLIYAKSNGLLLKLMGLDTIEQDAWKALINDTIDSGIPVTIT